MPMSNEKNDKWDCYTHIEPTTGIGQRLEVQCHPDDVEKVKAFFKENVRQVNLPTNKKNISHGGYGRYSRYDIKQHKYAGGGGPGCGGFIETLEIKDPPEGRCGFILYEEISDNSGRGGTFWEFASIKDANAAFEKNWCVSNRDGFKGMIRKVHVGHFNPWFYAMGDQSLMGDIVVPDFGIESDPEFISGKPYVVYSDKYNTEYKVPTVKNCVCCYHFHHTTNYGYLDKEKETTYKVVLFDDGHVWDEHVDMSTPRPKPALARTAAFTGIVEKLIILLAGRMKNFSIPFANGGKFIGRYVPPPDKDEKGKYIAKIQYKKKSGEVVEKQGSVEFTPTEEIPTLYKLIEIEHKKRGVELVKVIGYRKAEREKGWEGIYEDPYK